MSKHISNIIKNDSFDNQDDLNYSERLETGGFKYGGILDNWKLMRIMSQVVMVIIFKTRLLKYS